ncbi:hypothetical protein J4Q44_G00087970 [Coregonus suidteri]|uniref:Uncharacterized protein n=1 Tax=Coregonus suidteri TaxID=861788 RepID=A0AAN8MB28_9TELE
MGLRRKVSGPRFKEEEEENPIIISHFPLPRILLKLSPGFLPSRTSPLLPSQPHPPPDNTSQNTDQIPSL